MTLNTPVAEAMGARISLSGPAQGMYLVIGRGASPVSAVRASGGEIVLALNGQKMLATLPFSGFLSLQNDPNISRVGPVTVDLTRLSQVARMLAAAAGGTSG